MDFLASICSDKKVSLIRYLLIPLNFQEMSCSVPFRNQGRGCVVVQVPTTSNELSVFDVSKSKTTNKTVFPHIFCFIVVALEEAGTAQ